MLLAEHDLVCSSCGNLRAECSDPAVDWHPSKSVCYASAATQWGRRKLGEKYPADKKDASGAHPLDGVGVWVSTVEPAEGEDEFA